MKKIIDELKKEWLLRLFFVLALLGGASVFLRCLWPVSVVIIILINLYLFFVLLVAAIRCDAEEKYFDEDFGKEAIKRFFPIRTAALLIVGLIFIALVTSYAGIYRQAPDGSFSVPPAHPSQTINRPINALYFSVVTISTVGFGDFTPVSSCQKLIVMWEIASGILLFVCSFSFLISRIASFKSVRRASPTDPPKKEEIMKAIAELQTKAEALAELVDKLP